jgi:hypothetical protein
MTDFIQDTELLDSLKKLGFDAEPLAELEWVPVQGVFGLERGAFEWRIVFAGHTIEQVERWLWSEHEISIEVERFLDDEGTHFVVTVWIESQYAPITLERSIEGTDPFTAELEGIRQAVKYLTEQKGVTQ